MRRIARLLLIVLSLLALSGCNTLQGFGKDIEAAGKGIQRSTR